MAGEPIAFWTFILGLLLARISSPGCTKETDRRILPTGANRADSDASHHREISYESPFHDAGSILGHALGMALARCPGAGCRPPRSAAGRQLFPPRATRPKVRHASHAVRRSEKYSSTSLLASAIVPCAAERDSSSGFRGEGQGLPRQQVRPATGQEAHAEGR